MLSYVLCSLYAVENVGFTNIRQADIIHKESCMLYRYDKLVYPGVVSSWWNYQSMYYLFRLRGGRWR